MEHKSDFLGTENLRKLFWRLALPAIAGQLITLIYNLVDRIYIGHIGTTGGLALTGLGICTPLTLIITAFSQFICAGGGPILSYALGEKKYKDAEDIIRTSFIILLGVGAVLTIVMSTTARPLLYVFGASDVTYVYAFEYFRYYILGTIFVLLSTGMVVFITGQGATKVAMLVTCTGAVVNIILDPIFIWTLNMGIAGAAVATIISQAVSAILVLIYLISPKAIVGLKFNNKINKQSIEGIKNANVGLNDINSSFKLVRFDLLGQSLALGISPFIMQLTEGGLSMAFNKSLLAYGGDVAVGAMTLFTTINSIMFLPISGLCQGSQPITSYNYGAGLYDRVAKNVKRLIISCVTYTTLMWLVVMIRPQLFLSIFTSGGDIFDYSVSHIRFFFLAACIGSLQPACQLSFLALKNAKVSLLLALLRKIILLIPLIFILPNFIMPKDTAVLLAEPIADTLAVMVTTTTFFTLNRKIMFSKSKGVL